MALTKTVTTSPFLSLSAFKEAVVITEAMTPAAVSTFTSERILSLTMDFTLPLSWFRMVEGIIVWVEA